MNEIRTELEDLEDELLFVFGASDDLLELRGIIDDEIDCWNKAPFKLMFEEMGVVVNVSYDGIWELSAEWRYEEDGSYLYELNKEQEKLIRDKYMVPDYSNIVVVGLTYIPDAYWTTSSYKATH